VRFLFWTLVVTAALALINGIAYWFGLDVAGIGETVQGDSGAAHAGGMSHPEGRTRAGAQARDEGGAHPPVDAAPQASSGHSH